MANQVTTTQRSRTQVKEKSAPKKRSSITKMNIADAGKMAVDKNQVKSRSQKKDTNTEQPLSPALQNAVDAANKKIKSMERNELRRAKQTNADLYEVLCCLFEVYLAGMKDKEGLEAFLADNGVKVREGANPAHGIVAAFFSKEERKKLKERISQYSKAIYTMGRLGLSPDEVVDWLGSAESSEDVSVSKGLRKALNEYKQLDEIKQAIQDAEEEATQKAKEKQAEKMATISTQFQQQKVSAFGTVRKQAERIEQAGKVVLLAGYVDEDGRVLLSELDLAEDKKIKLIDSLLNVVSEEEGE